MNLLSLVWPVALGRVLDADGMSRAANVNKMGVYRCLVNVERPIPCKAHRRTTLNKTSGRASI